jgi:hypothetical protein
MLSLFLLFLVCRVHGGFLWYTSNTRYVSGANPTNGDTIVTVTVPVYSGSVVPKIIGIAQQRTTNYLWMVDAGDVSFSAILIYDMFTGAYQIGGNFPAAWRTAVSQLQGVYVDTAGVIYGIYQTSLSMTF